MGTVYGLYDPQTGELRYIGQTTRKLCARLQGHIHPSPTDQSHKANWIRSLLPDRPDIRPLGLVSSQLELDTLERALIHEAREAGVRLVNVEEGGRSGSAGPHSLEWRARQAEAMRGRTHSPETRERLSRLKRGVPRPQQVSDKLREINLGKRASEETRQKMRVSHTGKTLSEETRLKLKRPKSEETRRKMSEAQKRRFAKSPEEQP